MSHIPELNKLLDKDVIKFIDSCEVCHKAKQCRNSFPVSFNRSENLFDLIHVDVWGPYSGDSLTNTPYMLTIVEDCSRNTWTFLMSTKLQVFGILKAFVLMIKTQYGMIIKQVRSDNGSEFLNKNVHQFFTENGILHQTSCVYTPQQNGVVERKHRTLLQVARAMMMHSNLPSKFWSYSILYATWMINRLPSVVLKWKSSFELLNKKAVDLSVAKPFGSLVYSVDNYPYKTKFDTRAHKCVFLGVASNSKAYILYDMDDDKVFNSRDVKCFEKIFPYSTIHDSSGALDDLNGSGADVYVSSSGVNFDKEELNSSGHDSESVISGSSEVATADQGLSGASSATSMPDSGCDSSDNTRSVDIHRKGKRTIRAPIWTKDYVACLSDSIATLKPATSLSTPITFPYVTASILLPHYVSF